jgi:hypothetical protein
MIGGLPVAFLWNVDEMLGAARGVALGGFLALECTQFIRGLRRDLRRPFQSSRAATRIRYSLVRNRSRSGTNGRLPADSQQMSRAQMASRRFVQIAQPGGVFSNEFS